MGDIMDIRIIMVMDIMDIGMAREVLKNLDARRYRRSADAAPAPDASPDAEADPAALYLGYYGAHPSTYYYGLAGHHLGYYDGKRSADEPGDARRYRRSADSVPTPRGP